VALRMFQTNPCRVEAERLVGACAVRMRFQTNPCRVEANSSSLTSPVSTWFQTNPCRVEAIVRPSRPSMSIAVSDEPL